MPLVVNYELAAFCEQQSMMQSAQRRVVAPTRMTPAPLARQPLPPSAQLPSARKPTSADDDDWLDMTTTTRKPIGVSKIRMRLNSADDHCVS
jgi:hypothetical protein